ncbi:uncharacterized protein VP01_7719g1 [Puccinia sorghi]|uniref:CCHC-type domain-containing protein n=1 Tax=Puccinia sorghi TaxID=27349 RepID=A0A0L6UBL3_9BASI|nr:uncharacterized protein VP01_7719g1 [Puccinia sorghi]
MSDRMQMPSRKNLPASAMDLLQRQLANLAAQTDTISQQLEEERRLRQLAEVEICEAYPFNHQLLNANDPGVTAPTLGEFSSSFSRYFVDPESKSKAKQSLQTIRQNSSIMACTQQFNLQAYESGWDNTVLISLYRNRLKENIRIASQSHPAHPTHNTNPPAAADPNTSDLSAMNSQLSNTDRAKLMKNGECFCCCQKGHLSRDCPGRTSQSSRPVQLSDLEALIK